MYRQEYTHYKILKR